MDEKEAPPPPYSSYSDSTFTHVPSASPWPPTPPPLPPRNSSSATSRPSFAASSSSMSLSPEPGPSISSTFLNDPRTSSQASLLPSESRNGRRTLLLVYIHGFMGNETSFQSFPAHLHNLLSVTLRDGDDEDGYVVHTKVYPKFKTRHAINVATLEFSKWLSQFESETTDIVLLGHSMGGILGAEVVLLPSVYNPGARRHPRILGMIAFDTPFLGMHPGIISSGIASLFRPASPTPVSSEDASSEDLDPLFAQRPSRNFTITPSKKPANPWESTLHFIAKHHENLMQATGTYLMSHLEFAACLADPIGLKNRYTRIRALDDGLPTPDGSADRVRFANYYTISYGRDQGTVINPSPPVPTEEDIIGDSSKQGHNFDVESGLEASVAQLAIVGAGIPVKAHSRTPSATSSMQSMHELEPEPMSPMSQVSSASKDPPQVLLPDSDVASPLSVEIVPPTPIVPVDGVEALFPPVSAPPAEPVPQIILEDVDKQQRKALEKENKRLRTEYERQLKEHMKLVKAREKAIAKEREKQRKQKEKEDKEKERLEKEEERRQQDEAERQERHKQKEREKELQKAEKKNKPPRQRKFCITPSQPDATWTPVEMKGVDEVGAHCGLFFVGEVYAKLVGDVADRIEGWVNDERTRRLVEQTRDWECGSGYSTEKGTC